MKLNKVHAAVVAALTGTTALGFQTASAQEEGVGLEEIVVTATRREQDLQEVPLSIVAITGDGLETRGIQNVEGLNGAIPNLNAMGSAGGSGTSQTSFRVRGIPGVGTYIDGVWQISTQGLLTQEFVDIDRIEVLRGPQGTLFGRDSVGGAVRIFTTRPAEEFGAQFKGTLGSNNRHDAQFSADLPLGDNVKTKFTFGDFNRDGYITSLTTGLKGGGVDESNIRGDLLWTPGENLEIRTQYSRYESEFIEPRVQDAVWAAAVQYPTNLPLMYTAAGLPYTQNAQMAGWSGGQVGAWENRSQTTIPNNITTDQASVEVKLALGDSMTLSFLTGYTDQALKVFVDYDNSQYGLVEDTTNQRTEMISEEIQLSGGGDRIQWVAGVFYWDESRVTRSVRYAAEEFNVDPIGRADNALALALYQTPYCQSLAAANPIPPGPSSTCEQSMAFYKGFSTLRSNNNVGGSLTDVGTEGYAAFGEISFSLGEKTDLTVGGRYHDQDNYQQVMRPFNTAPQYTNREFAQDPLAGVDTGLPTLTSFSEPTARISLQHQFRDNFMGYVSFAQGFNSGGGSYITPPGSTTPVLYQWQPENLDNIEVGIRSDLLDGQLRFNATLFDTTWDDIQTALALRYCTTPTQCFDLPAVVTQNVGKANAQGAEVELTFAPTDRLMFNVNLGYLTTEFTEIYLTNAAGFVAGETEFSQAPKTTANFGITHDASLQSGGTFTTRFDYTYTDQYWRQFDPTLRTGWYPGIPEGFNDETGDVGTFNMRLTYTPAADNWDVALFGTNLTDEYILNSGFFHGLWGFDFATVARPREVGASLTFRF